MSGFGPSQDLGSSGDAGIEAELAALDNLPIDAHPEVLDRVHSRIEAELDRLRHQVDAPANSGPPGGRTASDGPPTAARP